MDGKDWLNALGLTVGSSVLLLIVAFIFTGGDIEINRIFGQRAQDVRYKNRQASPEMISGKRQVIDNALRDYCDKNKAGFKTAAKQQILDAASELDDLGKLPEYQQDVVSQLRAGTYECDQ